MVPVISSVGVTLKEITLVSELNLCLKGLLRLCTWVTWLLNKLNKYVVKTKKAVPRQQEKVVIVLSLVRPTFLKTARTVKKLYIRPFVANKPGKTGTLGLLGKTPPLTTGA